MNKIVIFGSTGQTGLCVVEAALKKGLQTRAFVRDPSKLPENFKSKVEIHTGDALNYNDVVKAISGVDGVVVALGTRNDLKPTTALSDGLKNILKAMKETNVTKVSVCLSSFLFWDIDKVPKMFLDLNADHQRMLDCLKQCNLDYIAVFPPHIADEPSGPFKIEHDKSPGRVISKYNLGEFLVSSLSQPEHYRKLCGIAKS